MERDYSIDFLRGFAAIMVVLLHSTMSNDNMDISNNFIILTCLNGITRWTVPVFVMISGAFLLNRDIPYLKLIKKIFHLIAILFVWNLLYFILINKSLPKTLSELYVPSYYHLWFLYMLIGVYAMIPLLRAIVVQKKEIYLILFWLIGTVCVKTFGFDFSGQLFHVIKFDYCGYFMLGYYLYYHKKAIQKYYKYILLLGISSFVLMNLLTNIESIKHGTLVSKYTGNIGLLVSLQSVFIFTLFLNSKIKFESHKSFISLLAGVSLGMYLLHPIILKLSDQYIKLSNIIVNSLINWAVVVIACIAISYIILKVPYLSRLIK